MFENNSELCDPRADVDIEAERKESSPGYPLLYQFQL